MSRTCCRLACAACAGRRGRCAARRCTWSWWPTRAATGPPRSRGAAAPPSSRSARGAWAGEVRRRTSHLDPADVWLATTDADTLVPVSWLRQQARLADQGWDAVAGTVWVADWSGYPQRVRAAFHERYGAGLGPHPPVHGANLGFRAATYLKAGGFPDAPAGEDHALVAALAATGGRMLWTRAVTVATSARREARAPNGFSHYLADLEATA